LCLPEEELQHGLAVDDAGYRAMEVSVIITKRTEAESTEVSVVQQVVHSVHNDDDIGPVGSEIDLEVDEGMQARVPLPAEVVHFNRTGTARTLEPFLYPHRPAASLRVCELRRRTPETEDADRPDRRSRRSFPVLRRGDLQVGMIPVQSSFQDMVFVDV